MRRGRTFADGDAWPGREGAIVDERFAEMYFPGSDAIGRRIQLRREAPAQAASPWLTIVGVAPTMPDFSPPPMRHPVVHVPIGAELVPGQDMSVVARSAADLAVVASAIRNEVRAIDPDLPVYAIETADAAALRARLPQRLVSTWFGVIALMGLVLSTLGVYALTAYGVAQRTQEIGVRMALGARASQVAWLFLRRAATHLAFGLVLGVCGALATGKLLQSFLVDTSARDPLTLAGVVVFLAAITAVASLIPSRRAARLDPVTALRGE